MHYADGRKATVSILANDQQVLRTAESAGVPLTVKDIRGEQALAGLAGNLGLILVIVIGLSFLLRRSAQVANRAMGFSRSQPRVKSEDGVVVGLRMLLGSQKQRMNSRKWSPS